MSEKSPYPFPIYSEHDLKAAADWFRSPFFNPDTMRYFKSRLGKVFYAPLGERCYFITSERFMDTPRAYTVRYLCPLSGAIETVGEFQQYPTRARAVTAAKKARAAYQAELQKIA